MATRPLTRLASAAVVTGIASLALAAPANAQYPKDPVIGGNGSFFDDSTVIAPTPVDPGWELSQLATGALAGLALAGAGVAGAAGLRRHQQHLAHPA